MQCSRFETTLDSAHGAAARRRQKGSNTGERAHCRHAFRNWCGELACLERVNTHVPAHAEGPTEPTAEEMSAQSKKSTIVGEVNIRCNRSFGDGRFFSRNDILRFFCVEVNELLFA